MRFFIDTSIFVDVLRSEVVEASKNFLQSVQNNNEGFSSVITAAELSVGAYRSSRKIQFIKLLIFYPLLILLMLIKTLH